MVDSRHVENRFFGHNTAADSMISVKFCVEKVFRRISAIGQIPALHRTYLQFWLRRERPFRTVPGHVSREIMKRFIYARLCRAAQHSRA